MSEKAPKVVPKVTESTRVVEPQRPTVAKPKAKK